MSDQHQQSGTGEQPAHHGREIGLISPMWIRQAATRYRLSSTTATKVFEVKVQPGRELRDNRTED